jgi:predicted O-methyltransferase YrrM
MELNDTVTNLPAGFVRIQTASQAIGFSMPSDLQTGALLKILAASKPACLFLEIGTGTGLATAWLLAGMDADSTLVSLDDELLWQEIAREVLGHDDRLDLIRADAAEWLETNHDQRFDLIFADAWPGKYSQLDAALTLLNKGGLYVIDDLLPQPNWPAGHADNVDRLVLELESRTDIEVIKMAWSTGILIATKR